MLISELERIVEGKIIAKYKDQKINNFKIDSREIKKGDVFICLKGNITDGNKYIDSAIKNKASCIITEQEINKNIPSIRVKDTYDILFKIVKYMLNTYRLPVIAITGSVGKTTTKELIAKILSTKFKVLKTKKNYNNHIGIPLTIFELNEKYDFLVLELGMNHLKEISKLSKLINPDVGIITNIGTSHIGNLKSIRKIKEAKLEILDGMTYNSLLLVNGTNKYLKNVKHKNIIKIGKDKLIPFSIKSDLEKTTFKLRINSTVETFTLKGPCKHLIYNFVLAIQVGLLYNIEISEIKKILEDFSMTSNRLNIIRKENTIIDDSYNSSYESLIGIIDIIKDYKNKIFIIGDILELGKYSKKIHKKIKNKLKQIEDLKLLTIGEYSKYINLKNRIHFKNNSELIKYLKEKNFKNHLILVKGSRKMKLDELIKEIN